jgi:hypothetical protein
MEYVMVPVPDEYVVDVMQYVARLVARASVVPWTKAAVGDFFDEIDEAGKSLLAFVARLTLAGKEPAEDDAAEALELSVREIRGIAREINEGAQRGKFEPLLGTRDATVQLRNGRTVQRRVFAMNEQVARMVWAHERTGLGDEPSASGDTDDQ